MMKNYKRGISYEELIAVVDELGSSMLNPKSFQDTRFVQIESGTNPENTKHFSLAAETQDDKKEGYESLEYEEDCYYVKTSDTPSFDQCAVDGSDACCLDEDEASARLSQAFVDDDLCIDDLCPVEIELLGKENIKMRNSLLSSSQDFLKTFIIKGSKKPQNFYNLLHLRKAEEAQNDMSPDSGINELTGLSPEEQEKQRQEWQQELAKRLAHSPPTKANRAQSPAGSPDFRKWESCRIMDIFLLLYRNIFIFALLGAAVMLPTLGNSFSRTCQLCLHGLSFGHLWNVLCMSTTFDCAIFCSAACLCMAECQIQVAVHCLGD
ncbi:hypothetical protein PR048_012063 [Dryococelus australis]|uniref:Uncharacterized protein n=1 Tax=Dryococelus australis TaxID=614101 RepID=A0ABQ9HNE1_9NEOP|nr:hypothetical protein PR048_012063 [Dryococelus australis]